MDMLSSLLKYVAGDVDQGLDITNLPRTPANEGALSTIVNVVLIISGAIAVLVLVIAGFRFIISRGNPGETSKARNAIIFSLVGLAVIIFAFSIVNFVVFRVT